MKIPDDATVDYIMQYKSQILKLAEDATDDYLRAILTKLRTFQEVEVEVDTETPGVDDNLDAQIVSSD